MHLGCDVSAAIEITVSAGGATSPGTSGAFAVSGRSTLNGTNPSLVSEENTLEKFPQSSPAGPLSGPPSYASVDARSSPANMLSRLPWVRKRGGRTSSGSR